MKRGQALIVLCITALLCTASAWAFMAMMKGENVAAIARVFLLC
ncbi:hypothetical protein [Massilia endophytica]|nr:hypothetical protein [Massilia endophytica]